MDSIEKLLLENKAWAAEKTADDPGFFKRLSEIQTPDFLWIGCSDSRVPANEITGTQPGEIFVHRNVANLVVNTDLNLLTVLEYAVRYLKVKHIIICGHYGCGGVEAAISRKDMGTIVNKWLFGIKNVMRIHKNELEKIQDKKEIAKKVVELNVVEQVMNLSKISIIQKAWKNEQRPIIHGWVYGLENGLIKTLCKMDHTSEIDDIFQYLD